MVHRGVHYLYSSSLLTYIHDKTNYCYYRFIMQSQPFNLLNHPIYPLHNHIHHQIHNYTVLAISYWLVLQPFKKRLLSIVAHEPVGVYHKLQF